MVMFDANMILRYLLDDNGEMAQKAEEYLNAGDVFVTTEVIAEVVYVLKGVYSLERDKIADTVRNFLLLVDYREPEVVNLAIKTYGDKGLDFVDCVLYAYHQIKGIEIATFDKKLRNLLNES